MHFLLALRNVAFAYKVQGPLHDTFMFEYHFFPMLQAFTRPVLKRNHFSEANLLRFPHCLVALGPGTTYLCFTPDPTWENETSGVETHSGNYHRSQFWGRKALTIIYELPMNIQGWFPLGLTGLICLLSKGLSRVFSITTVWKHQFFGTQPSLWSNSHIYTWPLQKP